MLRARKPAFFSKSTALAPRMPLFAVGHDLNVAIQLVDALRELAQRNQLCVRDATDLVFVRLAHVDQHERIAATDFSPHLQRIGKSGSALANAAE
jgi:hypothetical protein